MSNADRQPPPPFRRDEEVQQQHRQFHFRCDKERHHLYHAAPLMSPPYGCKEQAGVSEVEMVIRSCLYWPDGTRKKCSNSQANARALDQTRMLVQALLDQYNENHNLLGDLAYELKNVLHHQYIFEGYADSGRHAYYHLNFTTKKKGGDDGRGINSLFFVEVTLMQGEHEEMVVSCFCMVGPNDNGHCYGCTNNGSVGMKHPNMADAYAGGHVNGFLPFGFDREWSDTDFDEIAEEARIRRLYEDVDAEARIVYELGLLPDPQRATPVEI